jgi:hypothetical protein
MKSERLLKPILFKPRINAEYRRREKNGPVGLSVIPVYFNSKFGKHRGIMNRIDRLFAILLKISDGKLFQAEKLAAEFELSERTIYRERWYISVTDTASRREQGNHIKRSSHESLLLHS